MADSVICLPTPWGYAWPSGWVAIVNLPCSPRGVKLRIRTQCISPQRVSSKTLVATCIQRSPPVDNSLSCSFRMPHACCAGCIHPAGRDMAGAGVLQGPELLAEEGPERVTLASSRHRLCIQMRTSPSRNRQMDYCCWQVLPALDDLRVERKHVRTACCYGSLDSALPARPIQHRSSPPLASLSNKAPRARTAHSSLFARSTTLI